MNGTLHKWLLAALFLLPLHALAHEMSMAEMELRETSRGEFLWQWTATNDKQRSVSEDLTPQWPAGCVAEPNALHCGDGGLRGTLAIEGVGKTYSAALVKVFWLDGKSRVYTFTAAQPTLQLYGSEERRVGKECCALCRSRWSPYH